MARIIKTHMLNFEKLEQDFDDVPPDLNLDSIVEMVRFIGNLGLSDSMTGSKILAMDDNLLKDLGEFMGAVSPGTSDPSDSGYSSGNFSFKELKYSSNLKRNIQKIRHIKRVSIRDLF